MAEASTNSDAQKDDEAAVNAFRQSLGSFVVAAQRHAERFTINGENVPLSPKAARSLAIALHDLATNAVKYGAFWNDDGGAAIDWTVASTAEGVRLSRTTSSRGMTVEKGIR